MAIGEMPTLAAMSYSSSTAALGDVGWQMGAADLVNRRINAGVIVGGQVAQQIMDAAKLPNLPQNKKEQKMPSMRVVKVFIADTNENIPLTDRLLYQGSETLTDSSDQELFYDIDIKTILEKHNEKRVKVVDKTIKERTEYLEPARIRDLRMTVVTVASF